QPYSCRDLQRFEGLSCSFPDPFLSGAGNSPILGKIRECRPASNKIPVFFPCSQERPPVIAVTTSWDGGFEIKVRPSSCRTFVVSPQDSVLLRTCDSHIPSCCKRAGRRRPGTPLCRLGQREPVDLLSPGGSSPCSSWRSICAGDFSTSLAKKNLPSAGTIMTWILS